MFSRLQLTERRQGHFFFFFKIVTVHCHTGFSLGGKTKTALGIVVISGNNVLKSTALRKKEPGFYLPHVSEAAPMQGFSPKL